VQVNVSVGVTRNAVQSRQSDRHVRPQRAVVQHVGVAHCDGRELHRALLFDGERRGRRIAVVVFDQLRQSVAMQMQSVVGDADAVSS
jgi:hypothetical protein